MKKAIMSLKGAAMLSLVAGSLMFTSCTKNCEEVRDDNYNTAACDEAATTSKFVRENKTMNIDGNSSNGTYLIEIDEATEDYSISLITNFGLTTGGAPIATVSIPCSVSQNVATFSNFDFDGDTTTPGTASGTITYNTATQKVNIAVTLSGFGSGIDGTTNDTEV